QTNVALLEGHYEQLLAQVAAQPDLRQQMEVRNRIAYNRFLEIVEVIRRSPSLFLLNESLRKAQFESYPTGLTGSFEPTECPDWVDAEKLNLGLRLWQKDMVACLFVLFAESLPDCYLIKKGIPMLYRTERLGSQKYLAQRIYETGFMLRDVLRENGMFLLSQTAAVQVLWLAATVHKVKPDWTFQFDRFLEPEWTDAQGQTYSQADVMADPAIQQAFGTLQQQAPPPDKFSAAELGTPSFNWLFRFCLEGAPPPGFDYYGDRYLWGAGFLAAVKVRFFHASMRYYALQGNPPYDAKENGMPINQEDLAYTLLTFGYVIPQGVEKLGGLVSRAEKEAFLHCWKIVGHLMGVDPRLLTDDWDEARQLFDKIKSRQQASSEKGVALTRALCTFIEDLLPVWLPFRRAIAPVLIRDQLGADADELFDTPMAGASRNLAVRATWVVVKNLLLRVFFLSRYAFFNRTPYTRAFTDDVLRFLGDALIESWRQSFERQPFNLTCGEKGFEPNPEVTPAEHQEREAFRRKVFQGAALGLGLILMFHLCFWIGAFSLAAWQFCPTPRFASAARAVFLSMFWACLIEITWVYLVERKLRAWLRVLEFKPQPAL
ncbi:MAG: DUF2236 domain-containing protein, partial [Verrucomicrobia bacterium]|nr:DUF2236 domain-containing protein [Verrucomicrobiota bacterium]